jgi:hypothetical protein
MKPNQAFFPLALGLALSLPMGAQSLLKNGDFSGGLDGWTLAGSNAASIFMAIEEGSGAPRALRYLKTPATPPDNLYAMQVVSLKDDSEYRLSFRWRAQPGLKPVLALLNERFQVMKSFALPASAMWASFATNFYIREGGPYRLQIFAGARGKPREAENGESAFSELRLECTATGVSGKSANLTFPDRPGAEVKAWTAPGWDWSLPAGAKPVPRTGFSTWSRARFSPLVTIRGVFMGWKALSPREGVIDFKPILDELASNRALGVETGLHLMNAERQYVPNWILEKYRPPVIEAALLSTNQPWRMSFVPPWHPAVMAEWEKLLHALGKSGIPQRSDILYAYMTGIGASRGEELFLRPVDAEQWQREGGLRPGIYSNWLTRRAEAMLAAFAGVEGKLAWMNPDETITGVPGYREATAGLQAYVLERGAGYRGGGIDFQHSLFTATGAGAAVVDGYAVVNEGHPIFKGARIRGDENEEFGKYWEWRFGPEAGYAYRHRICVLHSLMLQQNVVMVSPETLRLNPELNAYAATVMGRGRHDADDAWCYLRECSTRGISPIKNLERWVHQRDVPGSFTIACRRVERFALPMDAPNAAFDFDARRTDLARGQKSIAFRLDPVFYPVPRSAEVKVTFVDEGQARWRLEYSDGAALAISPEVANQGDGRIKTANFTLPRFAPDQRFPGGMDFRLAIVGNEDAEFTMVRVMKGP